MVLRRLKTMLRFVNCVNVVFQTVDTYIAAAVDYGPKKTTLPPIEILRENLNNYEDYVKEAKKVVSIKLL